MSSPGLDSGSLNLIQLQEVDSSKAPETPTPPALLPHIYSPNLGMESQHQHPHPATTTTVCIPSPYTDSNLDYGHLSNNHNSHHDNHDNSHGSHLGPLAFYNPTMLSYARPPQTGAALTSDPPMTPFWTNHHHHHHHHSHSNMAAAASLTLHCPPQSQLVYNGEPGTHHHPATWMGAKGHSINASNSIISCTKPLRKRAELGCAEGVNPALCASVPPGKADLHFCAVCHDYASGYHYGVWSCEGCKAFFKRSIQGHNDYICPATNQCTIDKNRRKSCQACRLRKCYEVGMMKCGVRRERCSYRGARYRRGAIQTGRGLMRLSQNNNNNNAQQQRAQLSSHHHPPKLHLETPLTPLTPLLPHTHALNAHAHAHAHMSPREFICRIIEAEPPEIYLMEDMKKPFTESSMMMSLTNLADKELVLMITWAKKIPGFVELSLADQIHLLKCCWLEILMLGLMWRSVDHPGKLIFSPDFKLNREEGQCVEGIMEIFDMLLAATSRFRELKLQREEYVCLKAMILLNSNLCSSSPQTQEEQQSRGRLLGLLDSVIDALVWAISRLGLTHQQQTLRLGHLTMLLSHIRHVSNKGMDHLSTMKRKNVVLVYDLLLEMLDANTTNNNNNNNDDNNENNHDNTDDNHTTSSSGSSNSSQQSSPPPSSDPECIAQQQQQQQQTPDPEGNTAADRHRHTKDRAQSTAECASPVKETADMQTLDAQMNSTSLNPAPTFQSIMVAHMDCNDYMNPDQWTLDSEDVGQSDYVILASDRAVMATALEG